jgi:hypothetical protein
VNIADLRAAVAAQGADDQFDIRSAPDPRGAPDNVFVVEPDAEAPGWVVYYSERGGQWGKRHFDTEDEACAYALEQAAPPSPPPTVRASDPEDDARAARIADEVEQDRRRLLREAGYDPDTMQPLE